MAGYSEHTVQSGEAPILLSVWRTVPDSPCIIFLPGTMLHPLFYDEALEALAGAGFNVVGVHFAGHGKSPRPRRPYLFEDLVRNTQDAIGFARTEFLGPLVLLGSSQGGILALEVASRDDRVHAVFAHNILLPQRSDAIRVTRFPRWLGRWHGPLLALIRGAAKLFPRLPVPIWAYLDLRKAIRVPATGRRYQQDPLSLKAYPLAFLASFFSARINPVSRCPVVLICAKGDPLFPFDYQQQMFSAIEAPAKEMLLFELDHHLILNDCVPDVMPTLVEKVWSMVR